IQGTVFNDRDGDGTRSPVANATPPGGPFQPAGTPFPDVSPFPPTTHAGPAWVITIGPGGTLTLTATDPKPYDGGDDIDVGVVNPANSGLALLALKLTGPGIFGFDGDGISLGGRAGYEGPGTYFTNIDAVTTNTGMVNFDDGFGNGLQPGQQA